MANAGKLHFEEQARVLRMLKALTDNIEEFDEISLQNVRTQRWKDTRAKGTDESVFISFSHEPVNVSLQLGELGIPDSFEGLSSIGGQNIGESQIEESLAPFQYNNGPVSQLDHVNWGAEPNSALRHGSNIRYKESESSIGRTGNQVIPVANLSPSTPPRPSSPTMVNHDSKRRANSHDAEDASKRRRIAVETKSKPTSRATHKEKGNPQSSDTKQGRSLIRDTNISFDIPSQLQSDLEEIGVNSARKPTGLRLIRSVQRVFLGERNSLALPLQADLDGGKKRLPYTGSGLQKEKDMTRARQTILEPHLSQDSQSHHSSFESNQYRTFQSTSRGRSRVRIPPLSNRRDRSDQHSDSRGGSSSRQVGLSQDPYTAYMPMRPIGPTLGISTSNPVVLDSNSQLLLRDMSTPFYPYQEYVKDYQVEGTVYQWAPSTNTPPREDRIILGPPERVAVTMKDHAIGDEAAGSPDSDGLADVPDIRDDVDVASLDAENFRGLRVLRRPPSLISRITRTSSAEEIDIPPGQGFVQSQRIIEGLSQLASEMLEPWDTSPDVVSPARVSGRRDGDDGADSDLGKVMVAEEDSQEVARAAAADSSDEEESEDAVQQPTQAYSVLPVSHKLASRNLPIRHAADNLPHYRVSQRGKALPSITDSSLMILSDQHENDSIYLPTDQEAQHPIWYEDSASIQCPSGPGESSFHSSHEAANLIRALTSSAHHGHAITADLGEPSNSTTQHIMRSQEYAAKLAIENADRMMRLGTTSIWASSEMHSGDYGVGLSSRSVPLAQQEQQRATRRDLKMRISQLFAVLPQKPHALANSSQNLFEDQSEGPSMSQTDLFQAEKTPISPEPVISGANERNTVAKILVTATQDSSSSTDGGWVLGPRADSGLHPGVHRVSKSPIDSQQSVSMEEENVEADIVIPETQFTDKSDEGYPRGTKGSFGVQDLERETVGREYRATNASPVVLVPGTASVTPLGSLNLSQDPFEPLAEPSSSPNYNTEHQQRQYSFEDSSLPSSKGFHVPTVSEIQSFTPTMPSSEGTISRKRTMPKDLYNNDAQDIEPTDDLPSKKKRKEANPPICPPSRRKRLASRVDKPPAQFTKVASKLRTVRAPPLRETRVGKPQDNVGTSTRHTSVPAIHQQGISSSPLIPILIDASHVNKPRTRAYQEQRTIQAQSLTRELLSDGIHKTQEFETRRRPRNTRARSGDASQGSFKALAKSTSSILSKPGSGVSSCTLRSDSKTTRLLSSKFNASITLRSHADLEASRSNPVLPPPSNEQRKGGRIAKLSPVLDEREADFPSPSSLEPLKSACQGRRRCFAPRNKMFYPASVVDTTSSSENKGKCSEAHITCRVEYDDGSLAEVLLTSLYRCELHHGDEIQVSGKKGARLSRTGKVSELSSWEGSSTVGVQILKSKDVVFASKDIAIKRDVVEKGWIDRKVREPEDIGLLGEVDDEPSLDVPQGKIGTDCKSQPISGHRQVNPKNVPFPVPRSQSPPPSRVPKRTTQVAVIQTVADPSGLHRSDWIATSPETHMQDPAQPLQGYGFIVALSISDERGQRIPEAKREQEKKDLEEIIAELGGRVLNDAFEVCFQWGGQISDDGSRWIWNKGDLLFFDEAKAPRKRHDSKAGTISPKWFILLADRVNRNKKYMMALAAGIPCVDRRWILNRLAFPWHVYLLSAGNCDTLALKNCSQWIDPSYIDQPRTLRDIHEDPRVLRRPFADRSVLFVYPSRRQTDIEEDKFNHIYVFPMLGCLMGAARVEIVHDLKAASLKHKRYDKIVCENSDAPATLARSVGNKGSCDVVCSGFNWVSDCIVAGCFLDV
ncbi:hypothetical protein FRC16_001747 [Serendipita sp. 398]|nr:hypothetical protein FRC16_001747 [Serendipita sp. 398]